MKSVALLHLIGGGSGGRGIQQPLRQRLAVCLERGFLLTRGAVQEDTSWGLHTQPRVHLGWGVQSEKGNESVGR